MPPEMGVERRVLQSEWMLNCITVDIILPFNIVTFVNTFKCKSVYISLYCAVALHTHFAIRILVRDIMPKGNI